ncbi:aminotransferase class V-fold PLP-dependent enzyme [Alicyclobacillus sp. SO9]|uniref:aminotransferase class V-fold PLP-dependent enzyme n=1 Tax=Alicyclobacillus sp. SO9 TaxID=2665646 RepID=UPI0018E75388|nr:aminotransferase class V-fold PLP-dependent enzyme [Alicyclobacillus sp. SO9]QQE79048.1 aminotransferase class V-fold PLP-dependent enzyme [Alicyclobacillus sp. SO9]
MAHDAIRNEEAFARFRQNTIGYNLTFESPYGAQRLVYADWTASGRLYQPVEDVVTSRFGPYMANTHSGASTTGSVMTEAYHQASRKIKLFVGAAENDVLLPAGTGATGAVNKLQRLLGLRVHEKRQSQTKVPEEERPVIFVSHMEHHSNHTSWLETIGDVAVLEPDSEGMISPRNLDAVLLEYGDRQLKIGAFTAASNVSGIVSPYYELARIMHKHDGLCFVDFAAAAPYIPVNMHPADDTAALDAVYFSPHKFLGGPGSSGILVFNRNLYSNRIPDEPGGGTVHFTNPWGEVAYFEEIEAREDGGTPGILQLIRAELAFEVKRQLLEAGMMEREKQMTAYFLAGLRTVPHLEIIANHVDERLAVFSVYFVHLHYNLVVRLLNDRFGIQSRGGCSCAGTYGHYLFDVDQETSKHISDSILRQDESTRPGWIRISLHPMMTDEELDFILYALHQISAHGNHWSDAYTYDKRKNEFIHAYDVERNVSEWFQLK